METSVTYTSDKAFLSTDERWLITRIGRLAEKHPDSVNIIRQPQENDGCLYCEIPSKWVKITPPKTIELTDEQRAERAERMRNARMLRGNEANQDDEDVL